MEIGPYVAGPNDTPEYGLYTGDSFALSQSIPDASIDLILCDPVWWEFDQYAWLAETAVRLLKPGRSVIAQVGHGFRYGAETVMRGINGLIPMTIVFEIEEGPTYQFWKYKMAVTTKPYLWFRKEGDYYGWMRLHVRGVGPDKSLHKWGDSGALYKSAILQLTRPGEIVFDPFAGSAIVACMCKATARRWLSFEIDTEMTERGRKRLLQMPDPLIFEEYNQEHLPTELE